MFFTIITVLLSPSKLNYKNPIKITWPKSVTDVDVDLYCSATDGYPALFIHWFGHSGANLAIQSDHGKVNKDINV